MILVDIQEEFSNEKRIKDREKSKKLYWGNEDKVSTKAKDNLIGSRKGIC